MVLFFLGFAMAVVLLAYTSIQVSELSKKTEQLEKNLQERYSKPLTELDDIIVKTEEKTEEKKKETTG
jgi:membrane-anchored protein YejM (alkaline phosphatase superfamily)